jgi:hypothetical protein
MVASLQTVPTFSELKNIALSGTPPAPPAPSFTTVNVDNRNSSTAGGGGIFRWDPSSILADNDGTIIKPTGVGSGSGPGRWSRIIETGSYDFRWFGAKGDTRTPLTAVTMTIGSPVLTVGDAMFSSADVGKSIGVPGAGSAGSTLAGTITGFTSTTQVTLSAAASSALAGVDKTITFGADDTVPCQATIDAAMLASAGVEFSCGDYMVGPLKGNGSSWDPTKVTAQQPAVLSFRGQGRAPDLCRLIAKPGAYNPGQAVLTFRNVFGVVVSGFEIDANDEAEIAGDFAWIGTVDGDPDSAAPSCNNEFTHLYALKAKRMGFNLDQAADCKVSSVWYRGGSASVGVSMRLGGGGIWADNIFCTTGKLLVSCQNAGFQNCGFFGGIQITDPALNLLHFDACHVYPYTPKRTVAFGRPLTNPFSTTQGQTKVTVTMFNHGLTTGNFIEIDNAQTVGNLNLNTTATTPYAVTPINNDQFSIEASTPASSTATGGGAQVDVTGRGYSLFSAVPEVSGDPPGSVLGAQSVIMTACWFNSMGVTGQKYFAGRWMNGIRFLGCRFGVNSAAPAEADIYFDTDNWSIAGGGGTMPLFFFDNCTFAAPRPASITYVPPPPPPAPQIPLSKNTVLCGFHGYQDNTGRVFPGFETPGDIQMPRSSAVENRLRMGNSFMWEDVNGLPRWSKSAPAIDTDGRIMLLRQSGSGAPLNMVTPDHWGAQYYDTSNHRIWWAIGTTSMDWTETARLLTGTASPVGSVAATRAGTIFVDTTGQRSYVAYGTGNAQWDIIPRTLTGSATVVWPSIGPGGSAQTPVTVNGAAVGDTNIGASMSAALPAGMYFAMPRVTAANTVTVTLVNGTTGLLNPASGTLTVRILRS